MVCVKITQGLAENPDAVKIRTQIFIQEQHFVNEFDTIDEFAWHFVLYDQEMPIATGRIYTEGDETRVYHLGRIAVIKEYRKQGLGRYLMRQMEEKAQELGAHAIELSAQVQARFFYETLGYEAFGTIYLDEDCPHIAMRKILSLKK